MPHIYDNIEQTLLDGLRRVFHDAEAASFCVGYLNLRGWDQVAEAVERLAGGEERHACRVLVGMHRPPEADMKAMAGLKRNGGIVDGPALARLKHRITEGFKEQLECGVPSTQAETTLRRLAAQLRARKVVLKAFLLYPLHAKLYLVQRPDLFTPLIGFVGSSNLTLAGLSRQGELNVDVVEQDAARKLQNWFDERWRDKMAIDLSDELAHLIETSWARTDPVRPYLVYLKIAHHLCAEAREGEREFRAPRIFAEKGTPLLDFQEKAVSLAAYYLHRRGGVLLGDVVGLGKTLMATAIARIFQEDSHGNTLIVCPPKLAPMWEDYLQRYEINGRVLSFGKVTETLERPEAPRYRLVVIDESHHLRNRQSRRYKAIRDYIEQNDARVLLLTATPYNKQFTDLSNQLRLFVDEDQNLHVRPERFLQQWMADGQTEADFIAHFQTTLSSLRAFEQSPFPEDWRDLMRLFLVRRTRQFIIRHYAKFDAERQRYYVQLNGSPIHFPRREPKRVTFPIREDDPNDQYALLFHNEVVDVIERLLLPRYGLAGFLVAQADRLAKGDEKRILDNLNRAGQRLIGFCRTNLFKRLESSGHSFLLSVDRHILRNLVTLHALQQGLPIPIGTQDAAMLDTALNDADDDFRTREENEAVPAAPASEADAGDSLQTATLSAYQSRAATIYQAYKRHFKDRFDWLAPKFFRPELSKALEADAQALLTVLQRAVPWRPERDAKLDALMQLLTQQHPTDKALIFTQFADTALYLEKQLAKRGVTDLAVVTNQTADPVALARRFSPTTNGGLRNGETELRILIATDVLAEGQNLQDCHIIINFDLPWAIIRLIQRAGRVDRIGQQRDTITVYSFLPADGVERIIGLRTRLFHRLQQNQDVIGTDESFFGEESANRLHDLYTEKAGTLDDDMADEDIDLASLALQVWNSASTDDQKAAVGLPPIISATRALPEFADTGRHVPGVIAYLRYPDGADTLVQVDERGNLVSQSLSAIFRAAACGPDTSPLPRASNHHELVTRCVELATEEEQGGAGHLGSLRGARRKLWERLDRYRRRQQEKPSLFDGQVLERLDSVLNLIWRHPLKRIAHDAINRQMRLGITDEGLLEMVLRRADDDSLCEVTNEDEASRAGPQLICSLGLALPTTEGEPS
ncbi:MAG: helicase-related protein [Chloracidobacterium sp.]|uniref:NgoFVII family restriction endonuclease n=1 Tax=Chloracidobacterium validum TaxID=2821543 RepID=A0ABX8BBI0_9BACT|nr:helicase-related protein [Chloracidobacterium validum]QUW04203.1 NgoFVII family restriction endonuclease [Chloracidobacterium validum]